MCDCCDADFYDDEIEKEEMKTKIETKCFKVYDGYNGMVDENFATQTDAEDAAKIRASALQNKTQHEVIILQAIGKVKPIVPQMDIVLFT